MNTFPFLRRTALAVALPLVFSSQVQATGMIAGATEPTQIMNKFELTMSHLKHIKSLATRVQQYANQAQRLAHQVDMMKNLDATKARDLLKGLKIGSDIAGDLSRRHEVSTEITATLTSLSDNLSTVYREGYIAANVMEDLQRAGHKITGDDYLGAMNALAYMRVDTYGKRMEHVKKASEAAQADAENLRRVAALNPEIASEIQGLQAIIKTNEQLGGMFAMNNQLLTEQVHAQYELNQAQLFAIDEARIGSEHKTQNLMSWLSEDEKAEIKGASAPTGKQ